MPTPTPNGPAGAAGPGPTFRTPETPMSAPLGARRAAPTLAAARRVVLPLALTLAAACNDLLVETPRDQLTTDSFFRTEADMRSAIAAAYRPLADAPLFGTSMKSALIIAADDARSGTAEENAQIVALSRLAWNAVTPRVTDPWFGWYDVITKANLIVERLPEAQVSEASRTQVAGEAKFLRALGYFYLVRMYGDVPLVVTTAEQVGQPARTPKEQVYAQILKDAQEAEAALPARWDATNKGRAPKGAAQALLAEFHLWRSSAEQKNEWQLAADAAKRVIDSGVFQLEANYLNAFLPGSQNRAEEIFAAQASGATGAPTIRSADMFYPREMVANAAGGFGSMLPLQWSLDAYPRGDYRFEVTYATSGRRADGRLVTFPPHVFKYRPTTRPGPLDVNWPIYRYAEVLLFNAEALNELGRTAEAVTFLNQVRARARRGTGAETRLQPANYAGALTQAAVRDTIFEERRLETAMEGDRWFDLVRRGPEYFQRMLARDPLATDVQLTDMLWPIPEREIDVNPNLTQNDGY